MNYREGNALHNMKSEMHMSNLKLPTMSYDNLTALVDEALDKGKRVVKLAYATTAERNSYGPVTIAVKHHGSVIAVVRPDSVSLDNHGWDSMTTAQRLDRVLRDNGYSGRISIRQGEMALLDGDTLKPVHKGIRRVEAKTLPLAKTIETFAY